MKLTVIGGGGVRSMFLAKSIAQRAADLKIETLVFMDNDAEKLSVYGAMAARVAKELAPSLNFVLTEDADFAATNADYVITTIRVGGDQMRVKDERIALAHNVIGQETTGAAGLSFAMRSVPALADYCDLIRRKAKPSVKVFNFTNPAGVVSQTLRDMGYDFTYGICDAPSGLLRQVASMYQVDPARIQGECYGLNHLSFFPSVTLDGKELLPDLISSDQTYLQTDQRYFDKNLVRHMGCLLNEYLYYFYYREKALSHMLRAPQTRGEVIAEINRKMTAELKRMNIDADFDACVACFEKYYGMRENAYMSSETGVRRDRPWRFDVHSEDDGGYAGVALNYIDIIQSGKQGRMILCVPNDGAIPELEDSDVVEIACDITTDACTPHRISRPDARALELVRRVKHYERYASKAIRERSVSALVDALTMHPLVNSYSIAVELADAYIELNKDYIDGWQ